MCFEIASLVAAVRSGALQRVAIIYWPVLRKPLRSETLTFTQGDGCSKSPRGKRRWSSHTGGRVFSLFLENAQKRNATRRRESMRGGMGNPISLLIGAIVVVVLIIILLRLL